MYGDAETFRRLVPLLGVRPELQQICRFGAQWTSGHEHEQTGWAPFHIVMRGACLLDVGDRVGIRLNAGDVAVLPHGGRHTVRSVGIADGSASLMRVQPRTHDDLIIKSNVDGEPDTKLVCGRLYFEQAQDNMVLAALPSVIILSSREGRDASRLRSLFDGIQAELEEERLGAASIAAALAGALMMIVLRSHFESEGEVRGILALLAQRQTAKAVTAMLADPAHTWTLDTLADRANTSRATLVRLFQRAVGIAPLAFLAELRLSLARSRLLATGRPLAVIAEEVGYQAETAFSRAYRRRFGIAPGAERKRTGGAEGVRSDGLG